jgi:hypothetical protein
MKRVFFSLMVLAYKAIERLLIILGSLVRVGINPSIILGLKCVNVPAREV